MKAIKMILTTVVTMALLGTTVLAAAPSPTVTELKVSKAVLVETNEDVSDMITVTRLGSSSEQGEINANLKAAADSINAAGGKPENLKGLSAEAVKEAVGDDATIALVFDTSLVDNGTYIKNDKRISIAYQWSAGEGVNVKAIHMSDDGTWSFADTQVNGDIITVTSDGNSPFAFITGRFGNGGGRNGGDDGGKKSPQTGEYVTKAVLVGAAALMVAGMVCVVRAKKKSAQ